MPDTKTRHTLDELARLGAEAFDRYVHPKMRPEDDGKFVAIDIDMGDYELDEDDYKAVSRLRARRPTAEVWLARVGQRAAYQMRLFAQGDRTKKFDVVFGAGCMAER